MAAFIAQSPPNELNDVLRDVRALVDSDSLESTLDGALESYNVAQLIVASTSTPDAHQMIICEAGRLPGSSSRFADPRTQQSFVFDHRDSQLSDPQPLVVHEESEARRAELEKEAIAYAAEHYASGASAVFPEHYAPEPAPQPPVSDPPAVAQPVADDPEEPSAASLATPDESAKPMSEDEPPAESEAVEVSEAGQEEVAAETPAPVEPSMPEPEPVVAPPSTTFTLALVGNKYSPNNFWTGRWRSLYTINLETGSVEGSIVVDVHYYEQGNVQLSTRKSISIDGAKTAKDVLKKIAAAEKAYQLALNEAYGDMSDRLLRDLRRTLPVTKQKLDWARLASYKVRKELTK